MSPDAGQAHPHVALDIKPLDDLAQRDVLVAGFHQGEDEVSMGVELRAALVALAPSYGFAARPEPPPTTSPWSC